MNDEKKKEFLLARDGPVCQGRYRPRPVHPDKLELDHIKPKSKGGSDDISNRILLCGPCNRKKSDKLTLEELRALNAREEM